MGLLWIEKLICSYEETCLCTFQPKFNPKATPSMYDAAGFMNGPRPERRHSSFLNRSQPV